MTQFLLNYTHKGKRCFATIHADDWEDAEVRRSRLMTGEIEQVVSDVAPSDLLQRGLKAFAKAYFASGLFMGTVVVSGIIGFCAALLVGFLALQGINVANAL